MKKNLIKDSDVFAGRIVVQNGTLVLRSTLQLIDVSGCVFGAEMMSQRDAVGPTENNNKQ